MMTTRHDDDTHDDDTHEDEKLPRATVVGNAAIRLPLEEGSEDSS